MACFVPTFGGGGKPELIYNYDKTLAKSTAYDNDPIIFTSEQLLEFATDYSCILISFGAYGGNYSPSASGSIIMHSQQIKDIINNEYGNSFALFWVRRSGSSYGGTFTHIYNTDNNWKYVIDIGNNRTHIMFRVYGIK